MTAETKPDERPKATVALKHSFTLDGAPCNGVTVRNPNVGDLEDISNFEGSQLSQNVQTIALLCGLKVEEVRKLNPFDFKAIMRQVHAFTAGLSDS